MKAFFFSILLLGVFASLALGQSPTPTPDSATGLEGAISIGPVQGGPTRQGAASTKPLANVSFEVKQGSEVVTTFQTDEQGAFRVLLAPGHYTVSRKDYHAAVGSYGPFEVDVTQGKMSRVHWECDTGCVKC